ncbi:ABC transporter substrate-binding protein [Actinocatenispora rupis]|uniref:Sugar ABC transporter substrate-binding protein n=1 Tax=Actinocatenispora rupis TaxID=519421 RepID=A0A8J3NBS0_9ACTN|nr:sugar ABC transporter substrate-binding protein [Actinocatenispora rupis]GID13639.1 sugar ABC transporter substrate-binding protein [Actinocatenispora rupis]
MTGMRRRTVLGAVAGGAAALGLSACGGAAGGGQGSGKGTVVFRIWDEEQLPGYKKSAAAFHAKHPDITVKVEQMPWEAYWSKLTTELAAGKGPDIFWNTVSYFPEFVQQGVLVNLDPLIKQDSVDTKQFYPQILATYTHQGHVYGMPADFGITGMVYNADLFKAAGVPVPGELTWAPDGSGTLLETARKLTRDRTGKRPDQAGFDAQHVKQWGFMAENHNQTQYVNWIPQNGGSFMSKPFGKFTFDQPKAVQALQWQVDLITKWHVSPPPSAGVALDLFNRGQIAMYPCVNAILPYIVPKVNFTVGVTNLPSGPLGAVNNVNGLSFAMAKTSRNQKAAWEVVKWFGSAESQRIIGSGGYAWPANKTVASTYHQYWKAKGQDMTPFEKAATGKTVLLPVTPIWNAAELKIDNTFKPMFQGDQPVGPTTKKLAGDLNKLITQ